MFYSFYFNQIKDERIHSLQQKQNRSTTVSANKSKNLKSITDICLTTGISDKIANKKKSLVKKPNIAPLPVLGRLGPDRTAIQEKVIITECRSML